MKIGFTNDKRIPAAFYFLSGAVIGLILYLVIYDKFFLDVTNTKWIWQEGEDMVQHQLGAAFFRESPWMFPLGCYTSFPYPAVNSIVFSDSLPICALLTKLFSGVLPESFQYWGLWILFCFMIQGGLSMLILKKIGYPPVLAASVTPLFLCNVIFIHRVFYHCALASQWIILLAFLVWLHHDSIKSPIKRCVIWTFICCLSVSIHFYFLPMVGFIMLSDYIYDFLVNRKFLTCIISVLCSALFTIFVWYSLGGFSAGVPGYGNYGHYVFNLLGFFNSKNYSNFIPSFKTAEGLKAEKTYLGLGFFLLFGVSILSCLFRLLTSAKQKNIEPDTSINKGNSSNKQVKYKLTAALFSGIILLLWAAGPALSVGSLIVYDLRPFIPDSIMFLLSIIRTSSRMIWPVWYATAFLIAYLFIKNFRKSMVLPLIFAICFSVIQYLEIIPNHTTSSKTLPSGTHYESEFYNAVDEKLGNSKQHMAFLSKGAKRYKEPAIYAAEHHMTMNVGYFARKINNPEFENSVEELRSGELREDTLYCIPVKPEIFEQYEINLSSDDVMEQVGDFYIIYKK